MKSQSMYEYGSGRNFHLGCWIAGAQMRCHRTPRRLRLLFQVPGPELALSANSSSCFGIEGLARGKVVTGGFFQVGAVSSRRKLSRTETICAKTQTNLFVRGIARDFSGRK